MFYVENKVITYPCKTIVEDVLSRDGPPDENSFSPFMGHYNLLRKYINDRDAVDYQIKEIVDSGRKDFSAEKARPNDDGVNRDEDANEVSAYYTRLEDIDETFITKYVEQILYGFQLDQVGAKRIRNKMQTFELWEDEEDGLSTPWDVLPEEEEEFTLDDREEAKNKLPYLLKLLLEGSRIYKGSLLSFIIAVNRYADRCADNNIKPRDICRIGVYRVNDSGDATAPFVIEDNTGTIFRKLFSWAKGEVRDKYYKAGQELLHVCTVLGLNLSCEDARRYTSTVINQSVCTYMISNKEYIENYGVTNTSISRTLPVNEAGEIMYHEESDDLLYSDMFSVQSLADMIAMRVGLLHVNSELWKLNMQAVSNFLDFYKGHIDSDINNNLHTYSVDDSIIRDSRGTPIFFDVSAVLGRREIALLSTSGFLVRYIRSDASIVMHMSVQQFIQQYEGGCSCAWQYTSV